MDPEQITKYSRWVDDDNRVFIILNKWARSEITGTGPNKNIKFVPTTIDLLDVNKEVCNEVKTEDFERWVSKGMLKKIATSKKPT
jgi:hypothetical protein